MGISITRLTKMSQSNDNQANWGWITFGVVLLWSILTSYVDTRDSMKRSFQGAYQSVNNRISALEHEIDALEKTVESLEQELEELKRKDSPDQE